MILTSSTKKAYEYTDLFSCIMEAQILVLKFRRKDNYAAAATIERNYQIKQCHRKYQKTMKEINSDFKTLPYSKTLLC